MPIFIRSKVPYYSPISVSFGLPFRRAINVYVYGTKLCAFAIVDIVILAVLIATHVAFGFDLQFMSVCLAYLAWSATQMYIIPTISIKANDESGETVREPIILMIRIVVLWASLAYMSLKIGNIFPKMSEFFALILFAACVLTIRTPLRYFTTPARE